MKNLFALLIITTAMSPLWGQARGQRVDIVSGFGSGFGFGSFLPHLLDEKLLVDADGRAILIDEQFTFEGPSPASTVQVRGFLGNGESAWDNGLEEWKDHVVTFRELAGNELVLALEKPVFGIMNGYGLDVAFGARGGFDVGVEFKDEWNLVAIDTGTGAEKWSLTMKGFLQSLKPAGEGTWYLRYTQVTENGIMEHLAAINREGAIVWDTVTRVDPIAVYQPDFAKRLRLKPR